MSISSSIRSCVPLLESLFLLGSARQYHPVAVQESLRDLVLRTEISYSEQYASFLSNGSYNLSLVDGALLAFSEQNDRLRYVYMPNPHSVDTDFDPTNFQQIESIAFGENDESVNYPIYRYEFDERAHKIDHHPTSHLHIGHKAEGRIAFSRALSPLLFTMLIIRLVYMDCWKSFSDNGGDIDERYRREIKNCGAIGEDRFSKIEAQIFHLHAV